MPNRIKKPTPAQTRKTAQAKILSLLGRIDQHVHAYNAKKVRVMRDSGLTDARREIAGLRRDLASTILAARMAGAI